MTSTVFCCLPKFDSLQYPCPISDVYLREVQEQLAAENKPKPTANSVILGEPEQAMNVDGGGESKDQEVSAAEPTVSQTVEKRTGETLSTPQTDSPDAATRFSEKKRLNWAGKTCKHARQTLVDLMNTHFARPCASYNGWKFGKLI